MLDSERYLIALDLDGTLMKSISEHDEETFEYVKKLKKDGHIIMIATGRPMRSSIKIYNELGLDTPLINYDGAFVTNPTNPNYKTTDLRIPKEVLFNLYYNNKDILLNAFCEIHDDVYVDEDTEMVHPFLHPDGGRIFAGDFRETLKDDPHGALFFLNPENMASFEQYIYQTYNNDILYREWHFKGQYIVEIFSPKVDKSNGIKEAMEYYNIEKDHVIAIGDGPNDIGLLNKAHIKVAMGSAPEFLKVNASFVTKDVDNNGVLYFLKNFFEGNIKLN